MKKLITPAIYGQRQQPWDSDLLGYNTSSVYTIGGWGCLITSLGMYVGKNPREVNELLKANNGYVNGGNFVWSKCSVLGLKETYTSPYYDGPVSSQGLTKIKETIDAGLPLLCEVDFNANTVQTDMHWILLVGYEGDLIYALDPWTAQLIELGVYGGAKRAIIQFKAYDKTLPFEGDKVTVEVQKTQFEELVRKSTITDEVGKKLNCEVNQGTILTHLESLITFEDKYNKAERAYSEKSTEVEQLRMKLTEVEVLLEQAQADVKEKQDKLNNLETVVKGLGDRIEELEKIKPVDRSGWEMVVDGFIKIIRR